VDSNTVQQKYNTKLNNNKHNYITTTTTNNTTATTPNDKDLDHNPEDYKSNHNQ
jgi:hypothetical protein